jgi:hypothetical protein
VGEEYRSLSSSLCSFLYSPATPSLLGPNILLNTRLSKNTKVIILNKVFNVCILCVRSRTLRCVG